MCIFLSLSLSLLLSLCLYLCIGKLVNVLHSAIGVGKTTLASTLREGRPARPAHSSEFFDFTLEVDSKPIVLHVFDTVRGIK